MKRLNRILIVMAFAVALAGCRNDSNVGWNDSFGDSDNGEQTEMVKFSLKASAVGSSADSEQEDFQTEPSTRTALDNLYKYYWDWADKIGLSAVGASDNVVMFSNNKMVNNLTGLRETTIFDGVLPKDVYAQMTGSQQYKYTAYYPYGQNVYCVADEAGNVSIQHLELPSVQSVKALGAEGFPSEYDFMVTRPAVGGTLVAATVNDINLEFEHLFAAVKFSVSKDRWGNEEVKSITLTAPQGTPLTGFFEVNTSTMQVTFTEPSNSVTVNIPDGMGEYLDESDNCVWAIINPVDLTGKTLTLTVETESGLKYECTLPAKKYTRGTLHPIAFEIPTFSVKANIYTSYTRYLAGNISGANELDGQTIYVGTPTITSSSDNSATGVTYRPVGHTTSCRVDGTLVNATTLTGQALGAHQAEVVITLANGTQIAGDKTTIHITGLPYNTAGANMYTLQDDWETYRASYRQNNFLNLGAGQGSNAYCQRTFHIPANINVTTTYKIHINSATISTTGTYTVGSTTIFSERPGYMSDIIRDGETANATFTPSANTVKMNNSYGLGNSHSEVYYIILKYR